MNRNLGLVWILLILLLLGQAWAAYGELPERMPSHFNFSGDPDNFALKEAFLRTWLLAVLGLNAIVPLCGLLFKVLPPSMIHVPNRQYWLANEARRRQVAAKMVTLMALVFSAVDVMFLMIFESIRSFALTGTGSIPLWAPLLILPFIFVFPLIYMFRTFRVTEPGK